MVPMAIVNPVPTDTVDAPAFFKVRLRVEVPPVPATVPTREKEVSWSDGVEVAEPIKPVAAEATIPPTARTTPTMMKRSKDWEIPERLLVIFIGP